MPSDTSAAMPYSGRKAGALTFSMLFTMESLVRSLNAGVLSVQAYELLGSSRNVSILMTMASFGVLVTTLMLPFLLRRAKRRWAYTLALPSPWPQHCSSPATPFRGRRQAPTCATLAPR